MTWFFVTIQMSSLSITKQQSNYGNVVILLAVFHYLDSEKDPPMKVMNIITTLVYWSLSYTKSCCLNKKELGISFCRHHYVTKTVSPKLYPRENLYFKITIHFNVTVQALVQTRAPAYAQQMKRTQHTTRKFLKA